MADMVPLVGTVLDLQQTIFEWSSDTTPRNHLAEPLSTYQPTVYHALSYRRFYVSSQIISPHLDTIGQDTMKNTNARSFPTPDRLNIQFGVVAGSYVAALIAPVLTFFAVAYLDVRNWVVALGILGVIGIVLGSVVVRLVTERGTIAKWLNSGWVPWLLPLVGFVPVFVHYFSVIEVFASLYIGGPGNATSVVGAAGFVLGIAACWFGEYMVRSARTQLTSYAVANEDVAVEWTAAWPRAHRIKVQVGVALTFLAIAGLIAIRYSLQTAVYTLPAVFVIVLVTKSALGDRAYRVTPTGLDHGRNGKILNYRQYIPWSQFDGFTVTRSEIVLHRPWHRPSIRFSRRDIDSVEEEVIAALDEQLRRRKVQTG